MSEQPTSRRRWPMWMALAAILGGYHEVAAQPDPALDTPASEGVVQVPSIESPARAASRETFEPRARTDENGLDTLGWFHADPRDQRVCPEPVLTLLGSLDDAEQILRRGRVLRAESLERDHIVLHGVMELAPDDALRLGVGELDVAIKPANTDRIYAEEYKRELLFYALGRYLRIQALIPIVERDIDWAPLAESVLGQLTEEQRQELTVFENAQGDRWLHGSVQLWVVGYANRLGFQRTSFATLSFMARCLRHGRRIPVTNDPIWASLSDMIVIDHLVGNADRALEAGTVILPDGGQRLVLLDNGDALLSYYPQPGQTNRASELFERIELFTPNMVEGLQSLNEDRLRSLFTGADGALLVVDRYPGEVARVAREILQHIAELSEEAGGLDRVLFERAAPPMW